MTAFWLLIAIPLASAAILLLLGRRADRWGPGMRRIRLDVNEILIQTR